jgi:riboflavin kinase/FMN adenylyltransferase
MQELLKDGREIPSARAPFGDAAVCAIGNFDGVHVGHQRLLDLARARATALGGQALVLTFDPHPAKVLAPRLAPPLISTAARKRELIAARGIDALIVERFDAETAAQPAERFVEETLHAWLGVREVVVGYDFTYGQGRAGTTATLVAAAARLGFTVHVVPPVTVDGLVASSTKVRELLHEGNVAGARLLLGRDFDVDGVVGRGAARGRELGMPTANVESDNELLPHRGIYATRVSVEGGRFLPAATSLGTNPTFGPGHRTTLEAHLLDFSGDLYGKQVRVAFVAWLRGEERFASTEALVTQMRADLVAARAALEPT